MRLLFHINRTNQECKDIKGFLKSSEILNKMKK